MAINYSDYIPVKRKGIVVSNVKVYKDDASKFLIRYHKDGKSVRKIFKSTQDSPSNMIDQAIRKLHELQLDGKERTLHLYMNDAWQVYISQKLDSGKWRQTTYDKTNAVYVKYIQPHIGKVKVDKVRSHHIQAILDDMAHLSKRSRHTIFETLRPFYATQKCDSPILEEHNVKRNHQEEKRVIVNPVEKYQRVKTKIMKLPAKMRALFLFGLSGRRKMEVLTLKWEHISGDNYSILGDNSKSKVTMTFSMSKELMDALSEIPRDSEWVFSSSRNPERHISDIKRQIANIREDTGIEEYNFHWMRNLLVSTLAVKGVPVSHLSSILGHTDLNTINQYLSLQREVSSKIANDVLATL